MVLDTIRYDANYFLVRTETTNATETIQRIHKLWKETMPMILLNILFSIKKFEKFHSEERYQKHVITYLSMISIVLASLEIFGTTPFLVSERVKK